MKRQRQFASALALLLGLNGVSLGADTPTAATQTFDTATVHFEQNATDGDVEIVFKVKGGEEGLARLTVVAPDGRTVVDFTAPDASTLGIRQFEFESPEPRDIAGLKAAYPEGVYTFAAATSAGEQFEGQSTLNHKLPDTISFIQPQAYPEGVAVNDLVIAWTPVKNVTAYIIEIEQDELNVKIKATLPSAVSTFIVPNGFLRPGTEYQMAIGSVTAEGNASFVETEFTTAE